MRRLYLLLVVWCLLVCAPGIVGTLRGFGGLGPNAHVHGAILGFWIGGYVAQIGIFIWIYRIIDEQRILWWIAASILPWIFDWVLPVHPLYAAPAFFVMIGIAVWMAVVAERADSLRKNGVRATGLVLEVLKPWMNVVVNNVYIKRKVRVRIERRDGVAPYEALYNGLFMIGNLPDPGDRLPFLVDPKNPKHFDYDKEGAEAYEASRRSWASASTPSFEEPVLVKELEKLVDLHKRGELTDAEYAAAKKKLLH